MTLKGHKKHAALARPALGNFVRNEWAIVGAPCSTIKALAENIIAALSSQYKIAYVDALHIDEAELTSQRLSAGALAEYTEQAHQQQINLNYTPFKYQQHQLFNNCDLVLVNGNHHQAKKQVVIIDPKKRESLQKRVDQLTDVGLFLLAEGETGPFDFIREALPGWANIPVHRLDETEQIIAFFERELADAKPQLNALVLAGGKSERMGQDKGAMDWHGKEQQYYMADLLKNYTGDVFISCRADQQQGIDPAYPTIADTFTGLGPFGAILSAFREHPEKAWLIVACDLPLLDEPSLDWLVANRNSSAVATAFKSPHDGFPEPLIAIWEPKSYPVLLSFLSEGYSCPRKVLINSDSYIVESPDAAALTNVNTPEELLKAQAVLQSKTVI